MLYWRWLNRPQHPLLRLALGLVGLLLVAGVLTLGFFALLTFALIGTIVAVTRAVGRSAGEHAPMPTGVRVIEGEYTVLSHQPASSKP